MIVTVDGKKVHLEPETKRFILALCANGTPANEVFAAIVNGHMGRF